jgi:hypothetical protein
MNRPFAPSTSKALRRPLSSMVCVLLACGPGLPYRPGFLLEEPLARPNTPAGAAAAGRVGCLDVRLALACNPAVSADFPLVAFTLGNCCDTSVAVDFTRLRVTGRMTGSVGGWGPGPTGGEGADVTLSAFDPEHEIHPAVLGPRAMAREVLEYDATPREATRTITQLCIGLRGLSNGGEPSSPVCLTRPVGACTRE